MVSILYNGILHFFFLFHNGKFFIRTENLQK